MQRRGFSEHCRIIAGVEPEMLLKAIALKGEKADLREVMRDPAVDAKLKQALGDVMITTSDIIGMEGYRSQIRHRGHAAGWHYGNATLFVTPNLADTRASLLLQLHGKQYQLSVKLDDEMPELETANEMRRILASDPVAQAKFFNLISCSSRRFWAFQSLCNVSFFPHLARSITKMGLLRRPLVDVSVMLATSWGQLKHKVGYFSYCFRWIRLS